MSIGEPGGHGGNAAASGRAYGTSAAVSSGGQGGGGGISYGQSAARTPDETEVTRTYRVDIRELCRALSIVMPHDCAMGMDLSDGHQTIVITVQSKE